MQPLTRTGNFIGYSPNFGTDDRYTDGLKTLQYVGGTSGANVGTTSNVVVSLTGLTGGLASAPAANDLVVVVLSIGAITDKTYNISGYNQLADLYANDTYDANLLIGWKLMLPTPDTSVTFTGGSGNITDAYAYAIHVWRNADQSNPIETATLATFTNTGIPDPTPVTPLTAGSQILVAACSAHVSATNLFTASYLSNFFTTVGNDTYDITVGLGSVAWTSGAYKPAAFTISMADSISYSACSATFSIKPGKNYTGYKNQGIWDLASVYRSKVRI